MTRRSRLRISAYVIDIVLLFAVLGPLGQIILRLLGRAPTAGPEIWRTILWNFSLPCWLYFIGSARSKRGATLGQRWLGLRVSSGNHGQVGTPRAVVRTAVLLLPWELIHLSAFGLSRQLDRLNPVQIVGLTAANVLTIIYLLVTLRTGGRRSVHDFVAGTAVDFVRPTSDRLPTTVTGHTPDRPDREHAR